MEIVSIQKFIHNSPRKLRLVADMARKLSPKGAIDVLSFTPKAASEDLIKAIKTALANANQKGVNLDEATFKSIEVNEGPRLRRYRAGTRGRVKPYKRRLSHIRIVLTDDLNVKTKQEKKDIKDSSQKEVMDNSAVTGK